MDTLNNMRMFVKVIEAGGFSAAAKALRTDAAHVSRAISELESYLRTRLMNRTTRKIALTEAGARYLLRCQQMLAYVEEAEAEVREAHARPSGRLSVHVATGFGQHYIVPILAGYRRLHPEVRIRLILSQRVPDILEEGFDVAVLLAPQLPDSGLISQLLGKTYSILCAAPSYLAGRKRPMEPADLRHHECLQLESAVIAYHKWHFDGPDGQLMLEMKDPVFQVNVPEGLSIALKAGMGIGALPVYAAIDALRAGALVRLLPQYRLYEINAFAVYASRQYLDAKIKSFVTYLREKLPAALAQETAAVEAISNRVS